MMGEATAVTMPAWMNSARQASGLRPNLSTATRSGWSTKSASRWHSTSHDRTRVAVLMPGRPWPRLVRDPQHPLDTVGPHPPDGRQQS